MTVVLHAGDCLEWLGRLSENSVDSVVTDPPYHLTQVKRKNPPPYVEGSPYSRHRVGFNGDNSPVGGFMGKEWDGGDIAFDPATWAKVMRVLKPGGHMLAFAATRNSHRMICAIEDAGFEIRDQIQWIYGSGFPKSLNVGDGWGTALKPAFEPICLARKPLSEKTVVANMARWGVGAINIDECRVETDENLNGGAYAQTGSREAMPGDKRNGAALGMFQPGKTVECEFTQPLGRWPANIIHDGSDEVIDCFPDAPGQMGDVRGSEPSSTGDENTVCYGKFNRVPFRRRDGQASANRRYADAGGTNFAALPGERRSDAGSAARFFYCAKAPKSERAGSKHPTVKPLKLIRYLVRLVTPPGGIVLDPFAGTGTAGEAALQEGMRAWLIEREPEYQTDILRRTKTQNVFRLEGLFD